jgi:hypothetical protein
MLNQTKLGVVFLMGAVAAGTCFAQTAAEQPKYFRLNFVVKELEGGKVVNSRAYAMTISTGEGSFYMRTGNKVPIPAGGPGGSFTYVDVGVNIDCGSAKEIQGQLALHVVAEISSAASLHSNEQTESSAPPLIRQAKWSSNVIVPIRKPATIFSSDDPSTKRQNQLELTATPIT